MLDQSFSAHNFGIIYSLENRKGHIDLDDMPLEFRDCVIKIKQTRAKIQAIKNISIEKRTKDNLLELENLQLDLENLYQTKEDILESYLENLSLQIRSTQLQITLSKYFKDRKEIFYLDYSSHAKFFAVKQLQYNIYKTFKVKQANRHSILNCIKSLLETKRPISIIRTDISSFYESIDQRILLDRIANNTLLSPKSKTFITAILKQYNSLKDISISDVDKGVPRGIGISAYLSELYLKDLDKHIKTRPEVMFYARYVDDIFIILSKIPIGKTLESYYQDLCKLFSELGLTLKQPNDGSDKCHLLTFDKDTSLDELHYLGYKISLKRENGKLSVSFSMSTKKVLKIKNKIDAAFLHFESISKISIKQARRDLIDSLNLITGNYSLCKSKASVKVGLYYNNPLLDSPDDLHELTNYLHKKVINPYFLLFQDYNLRLAYVRKLRKRIESFNFYERWINKKMYKFTLSRLNQIESWL